MPAATATSTAIDWPLAYVIAPDAFYQRALVHLDIESRLADVFNLMGVKQASYTVDEGYTWDDARLELKGTADGGGEFLIRPETGCRCHGYKRTQR
jgi:hypothetical protein